MKLDFSPLLFQLNGVSTKEMTAATSLILAEHVEKTGNFEISPLSL